MELVERVAGDLPVMFLVKIAQGDSVRENLIEIFDTCGANIFIECDRKLGDFSERLNFSRVLMQDWAGPFRTALRAAGICFLRHWILLGNGRLFEWKARNKNMMLCRRRWVAAFSGWRGRERSRCETRCEKRKRPPEYLANGNTWLMGLSPFCNVLKIQNISFSVLVQKGSV